MGSIQEMEELFSESDYIFNLLPTTTETTGLLNKGQFSACLKNTTSSPYGTVFINAGRGTVISEEHLIEALDKKWISHAILDVFSVEPLPEDSALWQHSGVTITPHTAAVSMADEIVAIFYDNLERYSKEEPLLYCVDSDFKGY